MVEFTVLGHAVAQGRPRAGKTFSGRTVLYDPSKSRSYKEHVRLVASQNAPASLLTGAIKVRLVIYRETLKSFSKRKRELAESGLLRPVTKPDLDNHAKSVLDACNGIIYKDDSQIVDLSVSKFYSENPRVEIRVEEMEG
ncbi:RusA family crossover junction endodeoxyribonuclease [Siminovitchia terrae]|uniref:RusA family crossover junction endodeoxyribonuclease n=1 Tax=Siminovitchia terrae TaxID=1914933 RepID=UPI0028AFA9C1|nr:RusA family crossover junction endodeoxyribonuclease [Siminovitchia terrae]